MKNENGFTLAELATVLVVITLLCLLAIPQFYSLQNARRQTEMEKVVGVVQAGIIREQAKSIAAQNKKDFLQALDDQNANLPCRKCFNRILQKPLDNPLWFKFSDSEYGFSRNGNHDALEDYREKGDFKIRYDDKTGTLATEQIP